MNNDEFLKSQCNLYVNGRCDTHRCLKRGGYPSKVNPTCEYHEILLELQELRERVDSKQRTIERNNSLIDS